MAGNQGSDLPKRNQHSCVVMRKCDGAADAGFAEAEVEDAALALPSQLLAFTGCTAMSSGVSFNKEVPGSLFCTSAD